MGNLVESVDRNGQVRTYLYDALNRQVRETWLDSSGNSLNQFRTTYDAAGRSISQTDAHSSYQYSYDGANRLVQVTNTGSAGVPRVDFNYSYDAVGNRTHTTDSVNGILRGSTTYRFDELNRTVQILQSGNDVESKRVDMGYDAASQLTTLTRYNDLAGTQGGVVSTYTYDAGGRLLDLTHRQGSTILAQYSYSYDAANRITRMTTPEGDNTFNYDSTGQLTGADFSYQNDEAYSYDANGNRTNGGYQTGINNRLLSDGTYTYAYDHNGNLIQQTEIATGKVTRLSWDDRNRLVSVTEQDRTGTVLMQVEYRYDVLNRRIAKIVDSDGEGTQAATIERYVYEGEHVALVFDETGLEQERYLHGPVIDQVLAGEVGGETQWALTDHQGTVRQVVDESGSVVNQVSYDSFGTITNQSNPTAFFRFGYTGREHDTETGYTYYRNRYTFNGRFISEDPIGFEAGDTNLYRYVGNSPHNFTDPSGLYGRVVTFHRWLEYNPSGSPLDVRNLDVYSHPTLGAVQFYQPSILQIPPPLPNDRQVRYGYNEPPSGVPKDPFKRSDDPRALRFKVNSDVTWATIEWDNTIEEGRAMDPWGGRFPEDERGHIVPRALGGSRERYNIFSQNASINKGQYNSFAAALHSKLVQLKEDKCSTDPVPDIQVEISLKHSPNSQKSKIERSYPLRPTSIEANARFSDGTSITAEFPNRIYSRTNPEYDLRYYRRRIR